MSIRLRVDPVSPKLESHNAAVGKRVGLGHGLLLDGEIKLK
jgi:hypothetical protein